MFVSLRMVETEIMTQIDQKLISLENSVWIYLIFASKLRLIQSKMVTVKLVSAQQDISIALINFGSFIQWILLSIFLKLFLFSVFYYNFFLQPNLALKWICFPFLFWFPTVKLIRIHVKDLISRQTFVTTLNDTSWNEST